MRETRISLPELALIAGTRAAVGAGLGLLLADRLSAEQRKAVGWTLFLVGLATTFPLALEVFGGQRLMGSDATPARQASSTTNDLMGQEKECPMNNSPSINSEERSVQIQAGSVTLEGNLVLPEEAHGVVLFAHGSGSSRHSPRNRFVAQKLQDAGLATLLIDLLTLDEETVDIHTAHLRFNIDLLAERLVGATDWLTQHAQTADLPIGYFGASTGAAAALVAAAERPDIVAAIVSRGGRPDLAGETLRHVQAPTLLIVGGHDEPVIDLNREAFDQLSRIEDKQLVIVPGATHLFEEPGALEKVARLAADWFTRHLSAVAITPARKIGTH